MAAAACCGLLCAEQLAGNLGKCRAGPAVVCAYAQQVPWSPATQPPALAACGKLQLAVPIACWVACVCPTLPSYGSGSVSSHASLWLCLQAENPSNNVAVEGEVLSVLAFGSDLLAVLTTKASKHASWLKRWRAFSGREKAGELAFRQLCTP